MKKNKPLTILIILVVCISLTGCVTTYPKNFLKPAENNLQIRQLQMRQFESANEKEIVLASAGVLQDMGFTIDDSETDLGVIVASKDRDATNVGQVTLAIVLSALGGSSANAFDSIDKVQKIRVSVVTKLSLEGNVLVRTTFQRIVWNNAGNISRLETLKEPELYQGFFEKLSKAIFLEEQKI